MSSPIDSTPTISARDQEVLELIRQVNEQYFDYLAVTSVEVAELLADRVDDVDMPTYSWDMPLTLVANTDRE